MKAIKKESTRSTSLPALALLVLVGIGAAAAAYFGMPALYSVSYSGTGTTTLVAHTPAAPKYPPLDAAAYDEKLLSLAHVATSSAWYAAFMSASGQTDFSTSTLGTTTPKFWPPKKAYPANGAAILPFNRVVAYYGNFYSTGMGILGQYDEATVLAKLKSQVADWEVADPNTPVVPAIEYIDVTAQGSAGKDGKYRARMPDSQIDKALEMAKQVNGIVILDIQVGLSTLQDELPLLSTYLAMPNVHLAIDPEFSMKDGVPPGDEIGTMSSSDINYAANFLADLVKKNDLPPKILVVHRFTEEMVTGTKNIKPLPEVQIVMQMDGWGFPAKKVNTYNSVIWPEPVQFTGFKIFYKNDIKQAPNVLMTPAEVLKLTPAPIFIQYQ